MSIFYQEWAGGSFNNDGWWSWQEGNQQDCREIYWRNWQVRGESIMELMVQVDQVWWSFSLFKDDLISVDEFVKVMDKCDAETKMSMKFRG